MFLNLKYQNFKLNENLSDAKELLIKRDLIIKKRDKMLGYLSDSNISPKELFNKNLFELSNLCFIKYLSKRGFDKNELDTKNANADTFTNIKKLNKELETIALEYSRRTEASNEDKKELRDFIFTKKEIEEAEIETRRNLENNKEFCNLRDILINDKAEKSIGFFTRLLFNEIPTKEKEIDFNPEENYKMVIKTYNDIKELSPYISELPEASDRKKEDDSPVELQDYISLKDPLEKLMDDISLLKDYVNAKKYFINRLSKRFRDEFRVASKSIKDRVKILTKKFLELGKNEETGEINKEENRKLQNVFFEKQKNDINLEGLLMRASNYIKALNNGNKDMFSLMKKIAEVNNKYGENLGIKIIYPNDEKNPKEKILIIEVKSFLANQFINVAPDHCIAKWESFWEKYINDNNFNKQYYICDFNLEEINGLSVIGVTINENGDIYLENGACQDKFDNPFLATYKMSLKTYMEKTLGIPFSILSPMSKEEIEKRINKVEANRGIIMKNLSFDILKSFLDRGANPNFNNGNPLINAVSENNFKNIKLLLSRGADPNIGNPIDHINMNNSNYWEIVTTLIENEPPVNLRNKDIAKYFIIKDDYEKVNYLLYHGANPDFTNNAGTVKMLKLLVKYGATVTYDNFYVVLDNYSDLKYLLENGANPKLGRSVVLNQVCKRLPEKQAIQTIELLEKYGASISDTKLRLYKICAENFKLELLNYLFGKRKLSKDEYVAIAFYVDNLIELEQKKKNIIIDYIEKYSGYNIKSEL